jgi:dCTP deaminase
MVLSDREIIKALLDGEITVTPLMNAKKQIGSSSIDVRLGTEFKLIRIVKQTHFDLSLPMEKIKQQVREYTEIVHVEPMQPFILHPGEFALGSTLEYIVLPNNITGRLEGRSTWGRVGLQVHSTAGLIDPGFEGTLTFELHNLGKLPLPLYPGVRIAQIIFHRCTSVAESYIRKNGAKYAKSTGTKDAMFYDDYEYKQIQKYMPKYF